MLRRRCKKNHFYILENAFAAKNSIEVPILAPFWFFRCHRHYWCLTPQRVENSWSIKNPKGSLQITVSKGMMMKDIERQRSQNMLTADVVPVCLSGNSHPPSEILQIWSSPVLVPHNIFPYGHYDDDVKRESREWRSEGRTHEKFLGNPGKVISGNPEK